MPEFKIDIVSTADNAGFKSAADAQEQLNQGTKKGSEAADAFKKSTEHGGAAVSESIPLIEKFGLSHRELHAALHLIAGTSGPAAGAAMAGLGLAAGGGIGVAIMAVHELINAFRDSEEAAEKAAAKIRETYIETVKESGEAHDAIVKSTEAINDFFTALDRKTGLDKMKAQFAAQLTQIKEIAAAAEKAGIITKEKGDQFVEKKTRDTEMDRALKLDASIAALTKQLELLRDKISSPAGVADKVDELALKSDREKLIEAFGKGESFRPTSSARNSTGVLADKGLQTPEAEAARKQQFTAILEEIDKRLAGDHKTDKATEDHIKVLEATLERMTAESTALKGDVDKSRASDATTDFATGKGIADKYASGAGISQSEAQYLIILEQAITGKKLTLAQAVALIEAQSQNDTTILDILTMHQDKIAVVDGKLHQLLQQNVQMPKNGR
ncbi:MAG: hypothetical protein P4N60_19115 [Verrucomicrobiae bacterium]|nr:hypothetical protein [Verrucomicrobiae bacterium]